jgi:hypothetical protein
MWHASTRFGQPQSVPLPLERGKLALISNSGALFHTHTHRYDLLERYLDQQWSEILRQHPQFLHLSGEARLKAVDHLSLLKNAPYNFSVLASMVKTRSIDHVQLTKNICAWKQEIVSGK